MVAAFDTLSAAKALQAAGFERAKAEAVAQAIRSVQGDQATKEDAAGIRAELGAQQQELAGLRSDLAGLRSDLNAQQQELAGLRSDLGVQEGELAALCAEVNAIKWGLGLVAVLNFAILVQLFLS